MITTTKTRYRKDFTIEDAKHPFAIELTAIITREDEEDSNDTPGYSTFEVDEIETAYMKTSRDRIINLKKILTPLELADLADWIDAENVNPHNQI